MLAHRYLICFEYNLYVSCGVLYVHVMVKYTMPWCSLCALYGKVYYTLVQFMCTLSVVCVQFVRTLSAV